MDFICTFHMTPNKEYFYTYQFVQDEVVLMGNDSSCPIFGTSSLKIQMYGGIFRTLIEVRHILKLKRSLISHCTHDDKGLQHTSEGFQISTHGDEMSKDQREFLCFRRFYNYRFDNYSNLHA